MGMYCCCGVQKIGKKGKDWICKCDQTGWHDVDKGLPKKDGKYEVRVLTACDDGYEEIIEFSLDKKFTFQMGWSDTYPCHWDTSQKDDRVDQWKEIKE